MEPFTFNVKKEFLQYLTKDVTCCYVAHVDNTKPTIVMGKEIYYPITISGNAEVVQSYMDAIHADMSEHFNLREINCPRYWKVSTRLDKSMRNSSKKAYTAYYKCDDGKIRKQAIDNAEAVKKQKNWHNNTKLHICGIVID